MPPLENRPGYYSEIVFIDVIISVLTLGAVLVLGGAILKSIDKTLSTLLPPDRVYEVFKDDEEVVMKLSDEEIVEMKQMLEQQKRMHHSLLMAETAILEDQDGEMTLTLSGAKDKSLRLPFAVDGMMEMMELDMEKQDLAYPVSAHLLYDNEDGEQKMVSLILLSQVETIEVGEVQYLVDFEGAIEGALENVTLLMKSVREPEVMEEEGELE